MKVLYGTTNPAKVSIMNHYVKGLGIKIIGLNDLSNPIPRVDESGNSPIENAKLKSQAYYNAFKMPAFSCDSGLFFQNIPESLQPGTHVRRINDQELNDEEMIEYYSILEGKFGNQLIARYKNAISFIYDKEHIYNSMDDSLSGEKFIITNKPHEKRVVGFPLDSLSIECNTGKYYFDLEESESSFSDMKKGFKDFFEKALRDIECVED